MLPTLSHTGDFVLISPLPLRFHTPAAGVNGTSSRSTDKSSPSSPSGLFSGIKRGDIVIATSPTDPGKTVCKRVVGMEGDIVEVDPSRTKVAREEARSGGSSGSDNRRWEEIDADHRREISQARDREASVNNSQPRQFSTSTTSTSSSSPSPPLMPVFQTIHKIDNEHVRIPKGYVWLAGDNLSNSTDSRAYGPVPMGMLKGKVLARVSERWSCFFAFRCRASRRSRG